MESTILSDFNWARCLSLKDVIVGIENEKMDLINYIIILGKHFLWQCRYKSTIPNIIHFKIILIYKYSIEKHIAKKNDKIKTFQKRWSSFKVENINYNYNY